MKTELEIDPRTVLWSLVHVKISYYQSFLAGSPKVAPILDVDLIRFDVREVLANSSCANGYGWL